MRVHSVFAAVVAAASVQLASATDFNYTIRTTGDPQVPIGGFYGYKNSGTGPGNDAFQKCLALLDKDVTDLVTKKTTRRPLVVLWGKDGCATCSSFCAGVNGDWKAVGARLSATSTINAYFRGSGDSPEACRQAHEFFHTHLGGAAGSCHLFGFYGVYEDGTKKIYSGTFSDYKAFLSTLERLTNEYNREYDQHRHVPAKGSAGFGCGTGETTRLEMVSNVTQSVFVPFTRTNNLTNVETNWLAVTYPGETVASTNIQFVWSAEGPTATNLEVEVDVSAVTNVGDRIIRLEYLNTNQVSLATNWISCVEKAPDGTLMSPGLPGAKQPLDLNWGDWTLDFAAATNRAFEANSYLEPVTSLWATVERKLAASYPASNRTETVYLNAEDEFEYSPVAMEHRISFTTTNRVSVTVYTNGVDEIEIKGEVEEPKSFEAGTYTNTYYAVYPAGDNPEVMVTNLYSKIEQGADPYGYALTNVYTYVSTNAEHAVHGEEVVVPEGSVEYSYAVPGEDRYYQAVRLASEEMPKLPFAMIGSNDVYYVVHGYPDVENVMTNFCAEQSVEQRYDFNVEVTNRVWNVLTNEASVAAQTNYEAVANLFYGTFTDTYYDVVTNKFQIGKEGSRRDEYPCSATFAILGSPVWSKTAYDIFATNDAAFVKFCADNKMTLAVVDVEDATGASLFSHTIAATGRSGTSFLSRNGLCTTNEDVLAAKESLASVDAAYRKAPAGTAEFVLIRPDGSVAGRFAPYTGAAAATENSYRMAELLQLLDDPNEELNNDPATTPETMAVAYGSESPSNTLHASDRQDVFLVSGVPAGQPVSIALGKDRSLEGADVTMTVIAFTNAADRSQYREVKSALNGVWVFSAAEASSLGVIVSAWKNGTEKLSYNGDSAIRYVVKAEAAPPNAGKIFLAKESDNVLINDGLDYTFAVERTGYTGSAQVTIDVDEDLTTATNACYEWEGPFTVTWDENTWSVSNLTVKLIPTGDFSGDGDIVFRAKDCTGADFVGTNLFWLSVSQKPTENIGTLSIVNPEPTGETIYLSEGSNVTIRLNRDGNHNGTQRGRLMVSGGTLSTNEVAWIDYDMTDKTVVWTLPTLGTTTKKQDVRLLLSGLDGTPVDAAKADLSVCVLPADAPKFTTDLLEISAVQYADVGENQLGLTALPAGWTVKGIRSISGSLPSGFAINCAADGSVTVSGTTAGTLSGESAWWLELNRADGSATYSYPVTIRTVVTALAEANPWFKTSRTWTGLPIILASGDDAPISLRGALDLTIAKDGRTSAKYRTLGNRTASFAADRLAIQPNGTAIIEATTEIGGAVWGLEVTLWPGNAADEHKTMDMQVMISDPALAGQTVYPGYIGGAGAVNWSAERENEIRPWSGVYALAFTGEGGWGANTLCTGHPSVQVRFASESQWRMGRATYAGVLPNGKTISGSATFAPASEGFAVLDLPMLTTSAADDFAAVVSVTNRGADVMAVERAAVPSLWNHTERGFPQLSYSNAYAVVGSRFTATNDWAAVWGAEQLEFSIDGVRSGANLAPNGWRVKSDDEALSASLNRNSGAMMGVFREYDGAEKLWRPYQWKGSALPGAVNFMLGAYWYNYPTNVRNAADCEVRKTVRVGGSVEAAAVEE